MPLKKISLIIIVLLLVACDQGNETPTPPAGTTETAAPAYPAATETPDADAYPVPPTPTVATGYPEAEATATETVPAETATPDTRPTLTPPPAPGVDTAEEPDASQPQSSDVTITAADGLEIHATYATPGGIAPFPGVILLHMLGSDRTVWQDVGLVDALLQNGYAVLTVDMRGHGDTGGAQDWSLAAEDLQQVWNYFTAQEAVDGEQTAVVGASIGANMALITGANVPDIDTVVLLSPGLTYRGVTTEDALAVYGQRPLLIVAGEEDSYAADSSRTLAETAVGEVSLQLYEGAGHGTAMFNQEPGLTDLIIDWLNQHLGQS